MKEGKIRGHRTHKAAFSIPLVESARRVLFGLCPHLSPVSRLLPCGFWKGIFRAHICGSLFAAMLRGGSYRPLRPEPRLCPVRTRPQRPSRPDSSALYNVFLFPEKSFNLSAFPHKWLKTSVYVAEGFDSSTFQLVSSFQPFLSTFQPGCSILQLAVQSFNWLFNPSNLPSGAMSRSPSRLKALRPQMKLSEGLKNQTFQPNLP